jgi:hypothetical protein
MIPLSAKVNMYFADIWSKICKAWIRLWNFNVLILPIIFTGKRLITLYASIISGNYLGLSIGIITYLLRSCSFMSVSFYLKLCKNKSRFWIGPVNSSFHFKDWTPKSSDIYTCNKVICTKFCILKTNKLPFTNCVFTDYLYR